MELYIAMAAGERVNLNIFSITMVSRLRWVGHVNGTGDTRKAKHVFNS
jgi:hypothetical protein